jgi:hypothetical protein
VDTPEPPRKGRAASLGRAAQARGLAAAQRAGRGDEKRGPSMLSLAAAAASFACLFLPWLGFAGHTQSGWSIPLGSDYGLLVLAVVLVELLALGRASASHGSELVVFCLTAGAGVIGASSVANLRWGVLVGTVAPFEYGAWLGLAFAILLFAVGVLRLSTMWRSAL